MEALTDSRFSPLSGELGVPSPNSVSEKVGEMSGHVIEKVTSQDVSTAVQKAEGKFVRFNLEPTMHFIEPRSHEEKNITLLRKFKKELDSIKKNTEKEIDGLEGDDAEIEAETLTIHQNAFAGIIKNYQSFLQELDARPSSKNRQILGAASEAIQSALESFPSDSERQVAFANFFQSLYPILKKQNALLIQQLRENPSQHNEKEISSVANDCMLLLQVALKSADPKNFEPIKVIAFRLDDESSLATRWGIKCKNILSSSRHEIEKKDRDDANTFHIADSMNLYLKKLVMVLNSSIAESPMLFHETLFQIASHARMIASLKANRLLEKLKATTFSSAPEDAYKDRSYREALAYAEKCSVIEEKRAAILRENSIPTTDLKQLKQTTLEEIWNAVQEVIGIADDVVIALNNRKKV